MSGATIFRINTPKFRRNSAYQMRSCTSCSWKRPREKPRADTCSSNTRGCPSAMAPSSRTLRVGRFLGKWVLR